MDSQKVVNQIISLLSSDSIVLQELLPLMIQSLDEDSIRHVLSYMVDKKLDNTQSYYIIHATYDDVIRNQEYKASQLEDLRKQNEDVDVLLGWYRNKKSGKVVDARKKLQHRFLYLSYKDQVTVMKELLAGGKTDREWCYNTLRKWWSDEIQDDILQLWNKYNEERCGWLIAKFFSIENLKSNIASLTYPSNYYYICKRLAKENWFSVDKEMLRTCTDDSKYMWIMSQTNEGISVDEAMSVIFRWIAVAIHYYDDTLDVTHYDFADGRNPSFIVRLSTWNIEDNFYMARLIDMNKMLSSMCRMGMYKDVEQFLLFDTNLHNDFCNIHRDEIERIDYAQSDYNKEYALKILFTDFTKFYALHIPSKFNKELYYWRSDNTNVSLNVDPFNDIHKASFDKTSQFPGSRNNEPLSHEAFERLKEKSPALRKLVDSLQLEEIDDVPF